MNHWNYKNDTRFRVGCVCVCVCVSVCCLSTRVPASKHTYVYSLYVVAVIRGRAARELVGVRVLAAALSALSVAAGCDVRPADCSHARLQTPRLLLS